MQRHEEYALLAASRFDLGIGGREEAPAGSVLGALFLGGILSPDILAVGAELHRLWRAAVGGNGTGYSPHAALHEFVVLGCRVDCSPTSYDPRDADDPADDAAARLESARAMVETMTPAGSWKLLEAACTDAGTPAPAGGTLIWFVIALCLAGAALRRPEPVTERELRRMRAEAHRSYTGTGLQCIHLDIEGRVRAAEVCPTPTTPAAAWQLPAA